MQFGKSKQHAPLSILLWGQDGVGKTPTIMYLAEKFGPCAAIDADGGLAPYVNDSDDWIDYLSCEDPVAIRKSLEELSASPGDYKMLAIDPISTVYAAATRLADKYARSRSKKKIDEMESALTVRSWTTIKGLHHDLMRLVRHIGMPRIITAREANRWKDDQIVDSRPDGDKTLGHDFTLNIRLSQERPGGTRMAQVKRDRLRLMPAMLQAPHEDPLFVARAIEKAYGHLLGGQAVPVATASGEAIQEITNLIRSLRIPYGNILKRVDELFGKATIEDLSVAEANEILSPLREAWEDQQQQQLEKQDS